MTDPKVTRISDKAVVVTEEVSGAEAKKLLQAEVNACAKAVRSLEQRIAGLAMTPEDQRLARLEELQKERRDKVIAYYDARDKLERVQFSPPSDES